MSSDINPWAALVLLLFLISLGIGWRVYKYQDCIKVGHSKLYCIFDSGN